MKKITYALFAFIFSHNIMNAQPAMQVSGVDCYGNPMDIFADLDAGKAVILHFFMPSCGMCPPPAQTIQDMANNIMESYPGMIKGYAFPFQNSTYCDYTISWVEDNGLPFYAPVDSGATQVAYYGGFGMPTVVLLGGADHRIMFSTLSFSNSDTVEMTDSILALFGESTTLIQNYTPFNDLTISPNPANQFVELKFNSKIESDLRIEITDLSGNIIVTLDEHLQPSEFSKKIATSYLPDGLYLMRVMTEGSETAKRFAVIH